MAWKNASCLFLWITDNKHLQTVNVNTPFGQQTIRQKDTFLLNVIWSFKPEIRSLQIILLFLGNFFSVIKSPKDDHFQLACNSKIPHILLVSCWRSVLVLTHEWFIWAHIMKLSKWLISGFGPNACE